MFEEIVAKATDSEVTTEDYVQRLGPSSFVTRTIETTVSPRTEADIDETLTETHIFSDGIKIETPPLPDVPEET